ncbi:hypothetical protein Micr_00228 [Candidatus Micrarchaeum sp.]|jgi:hypothetical protein|uniref:hypothetical protein n=1 Tax=Candidatus Micrarchaeum sp. TaxID=2282148 RepID=UPI00092B00C8|nr:hypothetical protein [Candidatus Micrarchaeum sp.]OJI07429.1 MAG: hypothetical protein BK997_03185 [Candidatus Micrarchaeum sp. ARMAN-1]OJT94310.1 MAG: hypothetical protein JJ59_02395 [Candidatus Micrarchaeum sp. AZ1]OWP53512.1 MAG: hypothetical protein B2I19_03665 [Thermoplasmatales archaeon ARMAN]QRF73711.1 hypothetical protein Micr_00228 [Candidatus Micrarchaeum sp.]
MENITKKSDYSDKAIFVKISSRDSEDLEKTRTVLEKKLTDYGGELAARKSKHNSGAHESVIAIYFDSESQMSKAMSDLKLETLLRSEQHHIEIADGASKKNEMSKKYFRQEADKLLSDYIYETRWD